MGNGTAINRCRRENTDENWWRGRREGRRPEGEKWIDRKRMKEYEILLRVAVCISLGINNL